jgi:6-phosphogluconolactonase
MLGSSLVLPALPAAESGGAASYHVYFGTYSKPNSRGIYRAALDSATGKLGPAEVAAEARDPAFLAVHPNGRYVYAIMESSDPAKTPGRGVMAYAVEPKTGALTLLNEQSAGGPGPCHLEVDRTGRTVLVANYSGGSVAALPIGADGKLGAAKTVLAHAGSSVHPTRQQRPHAHAINVAPDNRFALVPDLGIDKVMVYRLDAAQSTLAPHAPAFVALPPGSGPRHLAFRPDGKFVYVINELLCTMAVFRYEAAAGTLAPVQTVSTLPAGETVRPGFSTAEVVTHPSGKFLYGSNRGHDSIAVFAVNPDNGFLDSIQHVPTGGKTPRHFAVDPTGRWLLAENQNSDTVTVFAIDARTGRLTPTGQSLAVPSPVCAVFVPRP